MSAEKTIVDIIGYDSGWGCRDYGCEDGPYRVAADAILRILAKAGTLPRWRGPLGLKFLGNHDDLDTKEKTLPLVVEGLRRLCLSVKESVQAGHIPVVIGGDHASAIGTWSGAVLGRKSPGKFGLIWIDAHLDSHTVETAHEGKWGGWWHGQPVSALTGQGHPSLTSIGGAMAKLSPQNISIIGYHSFETGEEAFVKKYGIKVYPLSEVQQRGFKAVFAEALKRATDGTAGFGMTIDLDAFQPSDAPGVGAIEDKGLVAAEVLPVLKSLARHKGFTALELAEYNPHRDVDYKTARLIEKIIETVF